MGTQRILVAVSGGIAAFKIPELVRVLTRAGHTVRCILTRSADQFVSPLTLEVLTGEPARSDLFDREEEGTIGHIDLADWADLVVLAPATAHVVARMAHGLADDLVTTVLLATRAPVLLAPAMNVQMWNHAATRENVDCLRRRGVHFVGPDEGSLACGWEGEGRMAEPERIAAEAELLLAPHGLDGEVVVVTAGGTREPIDAVRAITNRSSGKMGFAIAAEAARRGAEVFLVSAPTSLATPAGVNREDVETALEMRDAVRRRFAHAGIVIMAAAVADFRPAQAETRKIKKEDLPPDAGLTVELIRNPDILAEICQDKGARVVVGFAAESHDLLAAAKRKLARKGCDLLVANDISRADAGFDGDTNAVSFVWPGGAVEELPLMTKADVAARLLDHVEKLSGDRA